MRDFEIRQTLKRELAYKYVTEESNTQIVDELDLAAASVRIDVAVINGHFHGFEIKSGVDTLNRLPDQLLGYQKVFDFITVVTEKKHLKHVREIAPKWVGISLCEEIEGELRIKVVRKNKQNKQNKPFYIAKILKKDEIVDICKKTNIKHRRSERAWILCERLAKNVEKELIVNGGMRY